MSSEGCLFCGIVAGDIPAQIIDSDEHTVAFMDIMPQSTGHALVISREHAANLFEISAAAWVACTWKAFGKPWTCMPCIVRMPWAHFSESLRPSRPTMSKPARRSWGVPTSKPDA